MTPVLTREQLEDRLAALHRASLELIQDTSLSSLLERIARITCQQAGAQYAAVGVLDENGALAQFISIGMTPAEVKRMGHPPVGKGLIGALMHGDEPIRIPDIAADPRRSGFPLHHPSMTSFLGVPIRQGERQLGQIYLTNKLDAPEFAPEDQQIIETLAAYAAIAIANAKLYEELTQRDQVLTRRSENLALLNTL
ncbi:MAG: GAF domain-containing protein, partial [Chloroflexi bacterium]|nr:GAF domain-containing protein [Chloroflexota bacterium]